MLAARVVEIWLANESVNHCCGSGTKNGSGIQKKGNEHLPLETITSGH
jgi:hypothetical protein